MSHNNHSKKVHSREAATPASAPIAATPDAPVSRPNTDDIRCRAYEICIARNGGPGDAVGDWSQAEQELVTGLDTNANL